MDKREIKSIIEGLMFVWGDPLSLEDIKDILEINKKEAKEIIEEMIDDFNYTRRGVQIIQIKNKYQMTTRHEHFEWLKKLYKPKSNKGLSSAALETLSIISYKQPITKFEIEVIRGVKCEKALKTLLEKNLIKEVGRLEKTGRPILYGTTDEFLKHFGLKSLTELPTLEEINNITKESKIRNDK